MEFIFGIKLYMFRTVLLTTISSFSLYTQQWYISYRFADSLPANKFQKLAYLVGFIIRIYQDARPPERYTSSLFVTLLPRCHPHYPLFPNSTLISGTHIYQIPHNYHVVLFR